MKEGQGRVSQKNVEVQGEEDVGRDPCKYSWKRRNQLAWTDGFLEAERYVDHTALNTIDLSFSSSPKIQGLLFPLLANSQNTAYATRRRLKVVMKAKLSRCSVSTFDTAMKVVALKMKRIR